MTVFALSTAQGQSGVAIIRVSGPFAEKVIKKLTKKKLKPRMATLCKIYKNDKEIIDESVVIFFEKNKSRALKFVELHFFFIISAVLSEIAKIKGLRPAEPGEFTKRAYLSGKINLVQEDGMKTLLDGEPKTMK